MAIAGAAQATLALLLRPIFDRVLTAQAPQGLTPLLAKPVFGHQFYLEHLATVSFRHKRDSVRPVIVIQIDHKRRP